MDKKDRSGVSGAATSLTDAFALTVSATALFAGAYWTWHPTWIDRIPHWALLLVFGIALAVVWGLARRDRRLHTKVSSLWLKLVKTAWICTVAADLLALALRDLSILNKETIAMITLVIALLQALMAAGLWAHWVLTRNRRFAS